MAQDSNYIVSPPTLYFNAVPEQVIENVLAVENRGKAEITLELKGTGIKIIDSVGHIRKTSNTDSAATWFTFKESRVSLAAGEKKFVPFQVRVPSDTKEGSYSGAVDFVLKGDVIQVEKGSVLHIDIGKSLSTKLSLLDLKQRLIPRDIFSQAVQVQLVNTGDAIAQPAGTIEIYGLSGKITSIPIRDILIAPHQHWSSTFILPINTPGIYQTQIQLNYNHGLRHVIGDTWLISPALLFMLGLSVIASVIGLFIYHHKKKWKRRKK